MIKKATYEEYDGQVFEPYVPLMDIEARNEQDSM